MVASCELAPAFNATDAALLVTSSSNGLYDAVVHHKAIQDAMTCRASTLERSCPELIVLFEVIRGTSSAAHTVQVCGRCGSVLQGQSERDAGSTAGNSQGNLTPTRPATPSTYHHTHATAHVSTRPGSSYAHTAPHTRNHTRTPTPTRTPSHSPAPETRKCGSAWRFARVGRSVNVVSRALGFEHGCIRLGWRHVLAMLAGFAALPTSLHLSL